MHLKFENPVTKQMVSDALKPLVYGRTSDRLMLLARLEKFALLVIGHQLADPRAEVAKRAAIDILQVQSGFRTKVLREKRQRRNIVEQQKEKAREINAAISANERLWASTPDAVPRDRGTQPIGNGTNVQGVVDGGTSPSASAPAPGADVGGPGADGHGDLDGRSLAEHLAEDD